MKANVYLIIASFHMHDIKHECASMPLGFKFCVLEKFTALKQIKTSLTVQDVHALSLATVIAILTVNSAVQHLILLWISAHCRQDQHLYNQGATAIVANQVLKKAEHN